MVDWSAPDVVAANAVAFAKLMHSMLGLYAWEWFTSLEFDLQFFTGKREFRWPMIFYFANRYALLISLVGITISLNVTSEINCQLLYTFNSVFGQVSIGLASINLSLRTIAIWSQSLYIVVPLVLIVLGHWSLLLHGILLQAEWNEEAKSCVITETNSRILAITFIYSMVFDFVVLCLTAYKLFFPANGRSRLVNLIFNDGLIYFAIAFLANLIATIFMSLNLNPVMSIIANVPAAIASTIVACRAVRRLSNYTSTGAEFLGSSTQGSGLAFRSTQIASIVRPKVNTKGTTALQTGGVHVQMETFEHTSPTAVIKYDENGKMVAGDHYDSEAQTKRDDFKRTPY